MKYLKLFESYIKEGITFNIKDYGNVTSVDANGNITTYHRPDLYNILDICHAFKDVISSKNLITKYGEAEFEPDGGEAFKKTGIINLYLNKEFSDRERLTKIIDTIKEFANNHKLKIGKLTAETSNGGDEKVVLHVKGESIKNIRVIRIPIIENLNEEEEIQTELHVSNSTAHRILKKMGFDVDEDDYSFNLPAREILKKAESGKKYGIKSQDTYYNASDNSYIDVLSDMARWAIQNGYDTISGA